MRKTKGSPVGFRVSLLGFKGRVLVLSSLHAAKALGHFSDWSVSNLAMQKILYIAHMVYMGKTGAALISEPFEAWDYGPVLPRLYRKIKVFGSAPVRDIFHEVEELDTETEEMVHLGAIAKELIQIAPMQLVAMTHRDGGAWDKNYRSGIKGIKIPNHDIITEYESLGH